jgi:hypothetical protein
MKSIKTAAVALTLGFAVAASTAPAEAFFMHKKDLKVAAARITNPIVDFFHVLFHKK